MGFGDGLKRRRNIGRGKRMRRMVSWRWRIKLAALALFLFCLSLYLPGTVSATRMVLNVPEFSQQPYDQICWATRASMIIAYFKGDTVDRDVTIAQLKYGSNFNQPGTLADSEYYVRYYTGRPGSIQYNALSYTAVQYQINKLSPIGTRISWAVGGAHAQVIKGYDTATGWVIYNDPWDGLGHGCSYSYYVNNSSWSWTGSLFYA
ncbi:papain-like cysteine protease family protein [Ammonifex thiophilus]